MYLRWKTSKGTEVRLVESKAKLTPLDQKGEAVKAEICGAVFAARIRKYVEKHGRMKIERWFHLLDIQKSWEPFKESVMGTKPSLQIEWAKSRRLD